MAMEEILDGVRRIVSRWTITSAPLITNASAGDSIIEVRPSIRFRIGDEVTILTPIRGENNLIVKSIIDKSHIEFTRPIIYNFDLNENPVLYKTLNGLFVQGIYLGDPLNIPMYPAITVNGTNRNSEWLTLDSTKETYSVQINVYVEDSSMEAGYRFLLKITDTIQKGLKRNIYPLVSPYSTTILTSNAIQNDEFIKVADSSIFQSNISQRVLLEDPYKIQELNIINVIDANTIQVFPSICDTYLVSDGAHAISVERFIFNSWPKDINYGFVHKDTLLKASTIDWFAWEEEIQGSTARMEPILL